MPHHIFIWSPYQDQPGEKQIIDRPPHLGTLQEAINIALDNRQRWGKAYGAGQVIIATMTTYIRLD